MAIRKKEDAQNPEEILQFENGAMYRLVGRCAECEQAVYTRASLNHADDVELDNRLGMWDPVDKKLYCEKCAPENRALYHHAGECIVCGAKTFVCATHPMRNDELVNVATMVRAGDKLPPNAYCHNCYAKDFVHPLSGRGVDYKIVERTGF